MAININNNGTWTQNGDIVEGDKIISGLSQSDFNNLKSCIENNSITKEDIAAVVAVLQEINSSQNDLVTEYTYTSSLDRENKDPNIVKKWNEKLALLNGLGTLGKTVGGLVSKSATLAGPIAGYLGSIV